MRPHQILGAMALLAAVSGCGLGGPRTPDTTTEEPMPAQSITVAQATEENARYVSLVVSDGYDEPDFNDVAKIGCRTNPESLMSEGPPWRVRTTWVKSSPSPDFVAAALRRVDDLAAEGFTPQPWTRPDPEPPNRRAYEDARGYRVSTTTATRPSGRVDFELTVSSPCAEP
jgi:hypothetical protein